MLYDLFVCELHLEPALANQEVLETDLLRYEDSDFDFKERSVEPRCHLQVELFEV